MTPPPPRFKLPKAARPEQAAVPLKSLPSFFRTNAPVWSQRSPVHRRLANFGIPTTDIQPLLTAFCEDVESGKLSTPAAYEKYNLGRFSDASDNKTIHIDRIYTNIFYSWASDPLQQAALEKLTSPATISSIRHLVQAVDLSLPSDQFPMARALRRKVIMHVGPTNSGKTHNALRALAAAPTGVYAGPLRLLAHEIWERLNKGQIVPAGVDPENDTEHDLDLETALDVAPNDGKPAVVRKGDNPKYARDCNMLTGEEQKLVAEHAQLLSATVEMVTHGPFYDVGVIDEIQMIADPERGDAWTSAVLGLCTKELHLCGEETAVPVIEALLAETGDELVIKRYQRLTPLVAEDRSLEGDLRNVRKGDCLVTFSRSGIFALKKRVEELTGLRCAVAYGRLPPEIRSEQAALFNDPSSGYDVMVGSDAIGMGLNLYVSLILVAPLASHFHRMIKRIVFETTRKWDGKQERSLSSSQIKQIAGRAGRYGLHDDNPAGFVTTLHESDLPIIREALDSPIVPIKHARIGPTSESLRATAQALPLGSSTNTVYEVHHYVSTLGKAYRFAEFARLWEITSFIDNKGGEMTLDDKKLLMSAPIPWRDEACMEVVETFVRMYRNRLSVDLRQSLRNTDYMQTINSVEEMMAEDLAPTSSPRTLQVLETFHKVLGLYLWLSFRNPVTYADFERVHELKRRAEKVLDWSLQGVNASMKSKEDLEMERIYTTKQKERRARDVNWIGKRQSQVEYALKRAERRMAMDEYVRVPAR